MKRGASHLYALDDEQVEALLREVHSLEDKVALKLMVLLGMRAGEVCHMKASWIYRDEIRISASQPCDCVNCRKHRKHPREWHAKTKKSARDLPIPDIIGVDLYRFFNENPNGLNITRQALWFKVKRIAKAAKIVQKGSSGNTTFSHALRATAATKFARSGMNAVSLCYVMGWDSIKTAQSYIAIVMAKKEAHQQVRSILG